MAGMRARPAIASDDWMHEQQLRAELEAEAWRRLRQDLTAPPPQIAPPPAAAPAKRFDHHRAGSTLLKALVRFGLAVFMAYLAWIAARDSSLGEFEVWLAVGATFLVTLSLSMFGIARELVHALAETARWGLIFAVGLAGVWFLAQSLG